MISCIKQRLILLLRILVLTNLLLVSSFRAQPNGPLVLLGAGRRALGPPWRRTMQPGSFWATPYPPYNVVLVGTNQRILGRFGRRQMRPSSFQGRPTSNGAVLTRAKKCHWNHGGRTGHVRLG